MSTINPHLANIYVLKCCLLIMSDAYHVHLRLDFIMEANAKTLIGLLLRVGELVPHFVTIFKSPVVYLNL